MPFTIPDKGEGANDIQSILFQEDLDIVVAGLSGIDCVLSGGAITGGADMTPAVAKCAVLSNRAMFAVLAGDVTIPAADATNPRIDLIVVSSSGLLSVRTGTAAAAPKPPVRTANDVVLGMVYVPANDTAIATTQIIDKRVTPHFPVCIYRATTAVATNTAATVELLNKANAGVTIPSGLFLAGRILRTRLYGNMLCNSGTGANQLAIRYGGVSMYSFTFAAQVASATRSAWWLDFDLVAQGNADQSLNGHMQFSSDFQTTRTAPTTGIGVLSSNTVANEGLSGFSGAGTADSDTADRLLSVLWTQASNAAQEIVVEGATVELL